MTINILKSGSYNTWIDPSSPLSRSWNLFYELPQGWWVTVAFTGFTSCRTGFGINPEFAEEAA
jgi:hypothetical protein